MSIWEAAVAALVAVTAIAPVDATGQEVVAPLPEPEINSSTWVLIEVWPLPAMPHISFSAYFLDASYEKNQSLCEAAKRALDRDQEAALEGRPAMENDSYRMCLPLGRARAEGYVGTAG